MDFYALSQINYIWFSRLGSFVRLQKAVGKGAKDIWSDDDKLTFSSVYSRFAAEYESLGGKKLSITTGDAFLAFLMIYDYKDICQKTVNELKELVGKSWEEFKLLEHDQEIELKMNPTSEKKSHLDRLLPVSTPKLKIAFLYAKTPATSAWTYAHELVVFTWNRRSLKKLLQNAMKTLREILRKKQLPMRFKKDAILSLQQHRNLCRQVYRLLLHIRR